MCQKNFTYVDRTLEHCYVDANCKVYGDCCRDSKYYDEREQKTAAGVPGAVHNNSRYGCYETEGMRRSKMIGKCPPGSDPEVRDKCEKGDREFVSNLPVSVSSTGHTYKNAYCAWCRGERGPVAYWKPLFQCYGRDNRLRATVRLENASDHTLLYRDEQWYYADYGNRTLLQCSFQLQPPDGWPSATRPCVPDVDPRGPVDGCPAGADAALARACASYTYTLFEHGPFDGRAPRVFRNVDCARCNNVTTDRLACVPPSTWTVLQTPFAFGSLFAVKDARRSRPARPCSPYEVYDVEAAKCRDLIGDELPAKTCRATAGTQTLGPGEYDSRSRFNGTVYAYAYKKRIRYRDRMPSATGVLDVCFADDDGPIRPYEPNAYETYLAYAGIVGSAVSTVALVAHLTLFGTGTEPKNLPEKNMASLAVGLLLGYVSYLAIALDVVSTGPGLPCVASALAMQFGFLSAFAWMFVMSADVWIVLHASTKKLRVTGGKRNGRFVVYSAFAWLAPAALTGLAAVLQLSAVPALPELRPNFQHTCWFRNPQSLVALFVLPAGTTIVANYVSFVGAVRLIAASGEGWFRRPAAGSPTNSTVSRSRKNLKIYARLSLMMGLAWVFGLAGAVIDSEAVWTVYTVLNSLQGAFIFLAFDCDWKTVRKLTVFRKLQPVSKSQTTDNTGLGTSNT